MDVFIIGESFESAVLRIHHPIDVVFVVFGTALTIHLLKVVKEVGVHSADEPLLPRYCLLHCHKQRAADPVNEGTRGPLVRER